MNQANTGAAAPLYHSIFRPALFAGQTVVITGGGSGIGRACAFELASLGAHLALVGRKLEKLQAVAQELQTADVKISCHVCDIRDEEAVTATVAAVLQTHGKIDGLVNNAGGQFPAALKDISKKGWEAVLQTNLTGGFLMAREVLKQYMQEHGGAMVNISADVFGSMPMMGHSGAARAGMHSFTETAALEWAAYGVRVNCVAPGYIASSGMDQYPPQVLPLIGQAVQGVALQRMGTEAEVAAAICFLLSPAAAFISGTCVRVDGARPQVRSGWPQARVQRKTEGFTGFADPAAASAPRVLQNLAQE
ncbi:SDR family oxidoreductase [Massilia sp. W12]|uniref:SDR family oxidoreductase n=1 Tax=Massilia sp. W12 TaxID=3126507 RepID=UPI0030D51378